MTAMRSENEKFSRLYKWNWLPDRGSQVKHLERKLLPFPRVFFELREINTTKLKHGFCFLWAANGSVAVTTLRVTLSNWRPLDRGQCKNDEYPWTWICVRVLAAAWNRLSFQHVRCFLPSSPACCDVYRVSVNEWNGNQMFAFTFHDVNRWRSCANTIRRIKSDDLP